MRICFLMLCVLICDCLFAVYARWVCVCFCVRMYVCACACMYACECMYVCTCVRPCVFMHACECVCACLHVRMCVCVLVCMSVCACNVCISTGVHQLQRQRGVCDPVPPALPLQPHHLPAGAQPWGQVHVRGLLCKEVSP